MSQLIEVSNSHLDGLTPRQIVSELDKYIVGQATAKKSVAIALRNRMRRQFVDDEIRAEIKPKNILMIGATGVGKTEISRRLARLTTCPFVKVEATKFTEVGYVGRDVESMVRDLVDIAIDMVREEEILRVEEEAERMVTEEILDVLLPTVHTPSDDDQEDTSRSTREKLQGKLEAGKLEERYIEVVIGRIRQCHSWRSSHKTASTKWASTWGVYCRTCFPVPRRSGVCASAKRDLSCSSRCLIP